MKNVLLLIAFVLSLTWFQATIAAPWTPTPSSITGTKPATPRPNLTATKPSTPRPNGTPTKTPTPRPNITSTKPATPRPTATIAITAIVQIVVVSPHRS